MPHQLDKDQVLMLTALCSEDLGITPLPVI